MRLRTHQHTPGFYVVRCTLPGSKTFVRLRVLCGYYCFTLRVFATFAVKPSRHLARFILRFAYLLFHQLDQRVDADMAVG